MTIANWNALPDPTYLDCPQISDFAAKGWDMEGHASSGNFAYPVHNLGLSNGAKTGKTTTEITTKKVKRVDAYIDYCNNRDIVIKNKTRMSLINGRIIEIEENLGFIQKNKEEALLVCFVCGKYKPFTQMQADHFQPRSSINTRLISFYKAENYDGNKNNPNFKKMFIVDKTTFAPNYFYGLGFIFSKDNIWPVCNTCNGLNGKKDLNPFTFLKSQEYYGETFLKGLPKLNAKGILIRAGNNNETIAAFAIKHFADKFKNCFLQKQLLDAQKIKMDALFNLALKDKDSEQTKKIIEAIQKALKPFEN